jgi:polysaccharide export outer membrane protein
MTLLKRIFGLGTLAVMIAAGPVSGQTAREWDPAGLQMTRAELQDLLSRYQATASSDAYSGPVKAQAREEAELIRQRLEEGDIRAGDRIMMTVEGQPALTDTFTVMGTRAIILPQIGELSLAGILRSELQSHLTTELSRYIINPVVHARSLIRLGILGAVTRPGYYTVPSDMLFTDALMVAGGPSVAADLEKMTVQRGDKTIWSKGNLTQAVQEGRTLDQMSIRAGDNVDIPIRREGTARLTNILVVISGITSLVVVARQLGIF